MKTSVLSAAFALCALPSIAAMPFRDGETVVFLGDSITQQGRYVKYVTDFYFLRYPDRKIRFVNAGISGNSAYGGRFCLKADVEPYSPTTVSIMYGMNDASAGGKYYLGYPSRPDMDRRMRVLDNYISNMEKLADAIREFAPKCRIVQITPSIYDDTAANPSRDMNPGWNSMIGLYSEYLRYAASTGRWEVCDVNAPMSAYNRVRQMKDPAFTIVGSDRVHPLEHGAFFMAWRYLVDQGVDPVVSEVEVDAATANVVKCVNATVASCERRGADGEIALQITEKGLPVVIPPAAASIAADLPIRRDLNRQTLRVTGLGRGVWRLSIDGKEVLTAFADEFARGFDLSLNGRTPQYAQADAVMKKNAERHERESYLRRFASVRWFLSGKKDIKDPDDVKEVAEWAAKNDLTKGWFEKQVPSFIVEWPKRAEIRAEVTRLEEETRQLAQPKPHLWTIRRIAD